MKEFENLPEYLKPGNLLNQDIEVNIKPHSRNIGRDNFDNHFSLNYIAC